MSQYLSFDLKKKDDPKTRLCLGYFCTTPAREIANLGAFPYTEEEILLDFNTFKSYLELIKEDIEETKRNLQDYYKEKQEIEQNVFKCVSQEVAKMFIERIEDDKCAINNFEEILEDWNYRVNLLTFIQNAWEDNKDEWDLYYINC